MLSCVVMLAALAGCRAQPRRAEQVAASVPAVPGAGGPAWNELTTPHFTIWTDADADRAHALAQRMEQLRQVVVRAVFPTAPANARELAIVLRDDAELRAFSVTDEARPFAVPSQVPLFQPVIVLSATARKGRAEDAPVHELVHAISDSVIRHQPRWLAEGIATYYETLGLDPAAGRIEIGSPRGGRQVQIAHLVPIAELFRWGKAKKAEEEERHYITAWALFWYLSNQHQPALQRYIGLLNDADDTVEREAEPAIRIWQQAFPTLGLATVDAQLKDWLFNGSHREMAVKVEAQDGTVGARRMADADVYAVRALLDFMAKRERTRDQIAAALSEDPMQVLARTLAIGVDRQRPSAALARSVVAAHGDDWLAWMLLVSAAHGADGKPGEAAAAQRKACELVAANPAVMPPAQLCRPRTSP